MGSLVSKFHRYSDSNLPKGGVILIPSTYDPCNTEVQLIHPWPVLPTFFSVRCGAHRTPATGSHARKDRETQRLYLHAKQNWPTKNFKQKNGYQKTTCLIAGFQVFTGFTPHSDDQKSKCHISFSLGVPSVAQSCSQVPVAHWASGPQETAEPQMNQRATT